MTTLAHTTPTNALNLADTWNRLPEDERNRRAAIAANQHDGATLADLAIAYQTTRGRAGAYTIRNYRAAILRLVTTWHADGINLLRPTRDAGHLYLRHLEADHAAATVRVHLAASSALYRALRWAGATDAHPFTDTRVVKTDNRRNHEKRPAWEEGDLATLLDHAAPVDAALILLGARAGLRLAEALALTWDAVHLDDAAPRLEVIAGKGGKYRTVPLVPELTDALRHLQATASAVHVLPYRSPARARQRLARLAERAGVDAVKGRAIHSLRHTAGTAVYAATHDLTDVQAWLGHADVGTSRGYVHRSEAAALTKVAATLPRLGNRPA